MKKSLHIILSFFLISLLPGCMAKTADQNKDEPGGAAAGTALDDKRQGADEMSEEEALKELQKMKALSDKGYDMPPVSNVQIDVLGTTGGISKDDAFRSFLFRQSAVRRCYKLALVDAILSDGEQNGEASMTVRHVSDGKAADENYKSTIQYEGFEDCMKKAVSTWPLPKGTSIDIKFVFSARPAPTLNENRKMNGAHGGHGHDGHDHHDHAPEAAPAHADTHETERN